MEKEIRLPPKVDTVETQRSLIQRTTSLERYDALHARYFHYSDKFPKRLYEEQGDRQAENPIDREYFKLLALVGVQGAQFGYTKMEVPLKFNYQNRNYKKLATDAYHQLGLAQFIGSLNEQVYQYKKEVVKASDYGSDSSYGAWGDFYELRNEKVLPPKYPVFNRRISAEIRFEETEQICLPDQELNQKLAALPLTTDVLDRMTPHDFERELYPQVEAVLSGIVDTKAVFLDDPRLIRPHQFYSIPPSGKNN